MQVNNVDKTENFDACCKHCSPSSEVIDAFSNFLYSFGFNITQRSERPYMTPNNTAQLWEIRLPNPNKGKGTRGGYRTLAYYTKANETFYMDYIEEKAENTKKHKKQAYEQRILILKKYLMENYE